MKTLHLNLKKKWFDMILSGGKIEEYREVKESMVSLLFDWKLSEISRREFVSELIHDNDNPSCWTWVKNYNTITFSNGYAKDRPQFVIEYDSIEISEGFELWGAEQHTKYFVLSLGKIISKENIKN